MTFTPAYHEFVGSEMRWLPLGTTLASLKLPDHYDEMRFTKYGSEPGQLIITPGDIVEVVSAWTRDYLGTNAPTLLYCYNPATRQHTHLPVLELVRP